MADDDWMKEFNKITIPHAATYVNKMIKDQELTAINRSFNDSYPKETFVKQCTVTFDDVIKVNYFEKDD